MGHRRGEPGVDGVQLARVGRLRADGLAEYRDREDQVGVLEVVQAFARASGRPIPYQITARRPGDLPVSFADPSKAERELGWKAELGLDEMCADSWRWQSQNPSGYDE